MNFATDNWFVFALLLTFGPYPSDTASILCLALLTDGGSARDLLLRAKNKTPRGIGAWLILPPPPPCFFFEFFPSFELFSICRVALYLPLLRLLGHFVFHAFCLSSFLFPLSPFTDLLLAHSLCLSLSLSLSLCLSLL